MAYHPNNANGQATMANSEPVVIASDQSAVPVSGTVAVTGVATASNQTDKSQFTKITDGTDTALVTASGEQNVLESNSASIKTAVELIDNAVSGTGFNISQIGGAAAPIGAGLEATAFRVTLPTDGTGLVTVKQPTASNLNMTEASAASSLTSLQLIDDTVVAQGTALGTTKNSLIGGSVTTAAPTYTTGQISPLNMATTGALRVDVGATSANATAIKVNVASGGIASGAIASGAIASGAVASGAIASGAIAAGAITAGATSIATTEDTASAAGDHLVKVAQIRLDTPVSGANLSSSGDYTQFIADSFGKTWVAGSVPEDTAHIDLESIAANGERRIDTCATSAGTSGDWATKNQSAEGASWATLTPTTTSGLSVANFNSGDTYTALTNTAQVIKASAGNLYGYYIYNPNSSATYVMIYNVAAASVTVGTTTALMVFCIPATAAANLMMPYPITFSNAGWSIAAATTGGGNTAPATALEAMIWYK